MSEKQAALGQQEASWCRRGLELRCCAPAVLEVAALLHGREVIVPLQACGGGKKKKNELNTQSHTDDVSTARSFIGKASKHDSLLI